ncbi:MAG: DUF4349 domain-containing protein [Nocardioides sp.]
MARTQTRLDGRPTHPAAPLRSRGRLLIAAPILLAALLTASCSAGATPGRRGVVGGCPGRRAREAGAAPANAPAADTGYSADQTATQVREPAIISTGTVSLRSTDVGQARFDVQKVVDGHGGTVTDEQTDTGKSGDVIRSRMVLRIPSADFDAAMDELEKVAALESSARASEDVTTQVIDTQVRIRAQEQSLRRIELLLDRAQSIKDIVSIEAELTRRQADLDSLKQQQAWLADQTSLSTVTVHLQRSATDQPVDEDTSGFLAGLRAGWHALATFASGAATVVGTLLPWAAMLTLLGLPSGGCCAATLAAAGRAASPTRRPSPPNRDRVAARRTVGAVSLTSENPAWPSSSTPTTPRPSARAPCWRRSRRTARPRCGVRMRTGPTTTPLSGSGC